MLGGIERPQKVFGAEAISYRPRRTLNGSIGRFRGYVLAYLGSLLAQVIAFLAVMLPYFGDVDSDIFVYGLLGVALVSIVAAAVGVLRRPYRPFAKVLAGAVAGILLGGVSVYFLGS